MNSMQSEAIRLRSEWQVIHALNSALEHPLVIFAGLFIGCVGLLLLRKYIDRDE